MPWLLPAAIQIFRSKRFCQLRPKMRNWPLKNRAALFCRQDFSAKSSSACRKTRLRWPLMIASKQRSCPAPLNLLLTVVESEAYPHLPEIDSKDQLKIPGDLLKQIIDQTVIATSKQENRPMLTGIHLTITESELTAVATDSHRLSQRKATFENNATGNCDIFSFLAIR